ncbi:MAG: methylated-DNA--[protein]-cysteine S-methyltransferase [Pseudomonadota bacterium]
MTDYRYTVLPSPIGDLILVASDDALAAIHFAGQGLERFRRGVPIRDDEHPPLKAAATQLSEYFAGMRTSFDLPLDFGGTPFQERVWAELCRIPHGETRSYADIAQALGQPIATRAVGAANGRNPIPIVAPCHRVIGKDGSLTGFGGGLPTKEKLLALERG